MSFDKTKTDPVLGQKVHEHLISVGVETPVIDNGLSRKEKIEKIEGHFDQIVSTLGLDLKDDSLIDTPKRVAKMYVNEIFWGLDYDAFPKATVVENKMQYNEMVVEKGVSVQSYCEHHFVNIDGLATVAYVPNKKVLGLSKMNRIVEYFSRRPQIQERLTEQIYHALSFILETENVAVMIDAKHFCVKSRGVEDTQCSTVTSRLGGSFKAHPE
ncbi:GTP cyclohydrolase I FolE, partial [Gammaproteobacteria bacterium]|nr:GTP cyclohydrolase I FolE [Gammaproteobacteria bacterium]